MWTGGAECKPKSKKIEMNEKSTYIGVDLSKQKFDTYLERRYRVFPFTEKGIKEFGEYISGVKNPLVVYESTGFISKRFCSAMREIGMAQRCVNPYSVRCYAKCMGITAKTDKLDCRAIAHYAEITKQQADVPLSEDILTLQELDSCYELFSKKIGDFKNRRHSATNEVEETILRQTIKDLEKRRAELGKEMQRIIEANAGLKATYDLLMQIEAIGEVTARCLVCKVPELGHLNRRKIASLVGVAPMNHDSGLMSGKRSTCGGRKRIRCLLSQCVVSKLHCKDEQGEVSNDVAKKYRHLLQQGKSKQVALVACIRRLCMKLNAIVRDGVVELEDKKRVLREEEQAKDNQQSAEKGTESSTRGATARCRSGVRGGGVSLP